MAKSGRIGDSKETFDIVYETVNRTAKTLRLALEDREDCAQNLLLHLWKTNKDFSDVDNIPGYANRALNNLAVDLLRRNKNHPTVPLRPEYDGEERKVIETQEALQRYHDDVQKQEADELLRTLRAEFDRLKFPNPKTMTAARMRYGKESRSIKEIAAALGCSDETVRAHLGRVLDRLRRKLKIALENSG